MNKRGINSILGLGFKPTLKVENDRIYVALSRESKEGQDFIGINGFDNTRRKGDLPDLAWYEIDMPSGFELRNLDKEDEFVPTAQMIKYSDEFIRLNGDCDGAIKKLKMSRGTISKWQKNKDFNTWINVRYMDAMATKLPKILNSAIESASDGGNAQTLKMIFEQYVPKEVKETAKKTIIDFSKYLEVVRANEH